MICCYWLTFKFELQAKQTNNKKIKEQQQQQTKKRWSDQALIKFNNHFTMKIIMLGKKIY